MKRKLILSVLLFTFLAAAGSAWGQKEKDQTPTGEQETPLQQAIQRSEITGRPLLVVAGDPST